MLLVLGLILTLWTSDLVYGERVRRSGCLSQSDIPAYVGRCIGLLGVLNGTADHTQEQVCRVYDEVLHCIYLKDHAKNGNCDQLQDYVQYLSPIFLSQSSHFGGPWMLNLGINKCAVNDYRNTTLCSSPERVGLISSLGCLRNILKGVAQSPNTQRFICSSVLSTIEGCTDNFMGIVGEHHCTHNEIMSGLKSNSAKQWVNAHYPRLTAVLDECFTVYQPGEVSQDSECFDFPYMQRYTVQAMAVMHSINKTAVGEDVYCQAFYYSLHLLQHEMEKLGHACAITDLQHIMVTILGYHGQDRAALIACSGQFPTSTAGFCQDKKMALTVLANDPFCKSYIRSVTHAKTDTGLCLTLKQFDACAESKLHYAGFDCDTTSLFSVANHQQYFTSTHAFTLPDCGTASGQFPTSTAGFCQDKKMALTVLANDPFCKSYIRSVTHAKTDTGLCLTLKQFDACAESKLHYAGFDCDTTSLFSVANHQQYFTSTHAFTLPDCGTASGQKLIG